MLSQQQKEMFAKLNMPYEAVAVKFLRNRPAGYEPAEGKGLFCAFLKRAQEEHRAFYITVDNEDCMGKVVMGMKELETNHGSGQVGCEMGMFRTPAANARLYYEAPMMKRGTVNYVIFCPVSLCEFSPDLVVCVADTESAHLILRASSYVSGDLWESRCSFVMSCAWTYVYPYISGRINHLFTGMHLGLRIQGLYPPGLHILSIPYQKLDEVTNSLAEMEWYPDSLRKDKDEESRRSNDARMARVDKLRDDITEPIQVS